MSDEDIIGPVQELVDSIIKQTVTLHEQIKHGKVSYSLYSDYFEIANYQLGSLDSVMLLANNKRYREAFVVLRTELEHMMLFKLMTRGNRYFLLFKKYKGDSDEVAIQKLNKQIAEDKRNGKKTSALRAAKYPTDGVVKVIYQGPFVNGERRKGNLVPYYLNLYKNFDPEAAFLNEGDYFRYLHQTLARVDIANKRKAENKYLYTHYMSYRALLHSLQLNRLFTKPQITRLEAHYNFLSEFTHPTEKSMERIKVRNSHNSNVQSLDEIREDHPTLRLLASLYAGYMAASFAEDLIYILKNAPKKYIAGFEPVELQQSIDKFYKLTDYFWFIQNGPHDYDKFYYCVHYGDRVALGGDYRRVDPKRVTFNKNILDRLKRLQGGWDNAAWNKYRPPFTFTNLKMF